MKINHLILLALLSSCFGKKAQYEPLIKTIDSPDELLISNINIFNGIDSTLLVEYDVWITNGEITNIYPHSTEKSVDVHVIDGTNKYLIPGLIDTHVHSMASGSAPWSMVRPNAEKNMEAWLAAGITTVYDLGGIPSQSKKLRNKIENKEIIGPDIYFTGSPITAPGGHPIKASKSMLPFPLSLLVNFIIQSADHKTNIPKLIDGYVSDEVDYIKIINDQLPEGSPQIDQNVMKSIIDESHKRGLKTFVHIGNEKDLMTALEANADIIAHFPYRSSLSSDSNGHNLLSSETKIIHTFTGFENTLKISRGIYEPTELDKRMHPSEFTIPVTGKNGLEINETDILDEFSQTLSNNQINWEKSLRILREKSVSFTIGTDSPLPGAYPGSSFHQELQRLNQEGYNTFELLRASTYEAANLFLERPNFGTIDVGKIANLLIVNRNPIEQIEHTSDIHLIIKRGTIHEPLY
ncbi:amidohydrolase family protein [Ekhidna sp.]